MENSKEVKSKYDIIIATDGIDILKLVMDNQIQDRKIKAIFTDENMEYLNGSEAIKQIKSMEKSKKVEPILFFSVTAFNDPNTKKNISIAGAEKILCKPISKKMLEEVFEEYKLL